MSQSGWYYASNNQRIGPVTVEQLRHLLSVGSVGANDLIWTEGMADWQPAGSVPGLMTAPPPQPQPPPYDPHGHGQPQPYHPQPGPPSPLGYDGYGGRSRPSHQGMAIAGFVLAFVIAPLGLIFSWVALNGMRASGNDEGKGFAIAGLVLSILVVGVWCLWGVAAVSCLSMRVH